MKTDRQLQKDVIAELSWDASIDASLIGVTAKDGIVTLIGTVDQYAQKCAVEEAVQKVAGVVALAVEVEVNQAGSFIRSDADIARTAENVLQWTANFPSEKVHILVENGWITLSGTLEYAHQKHIATDAVRNLMDVKGVSNLINIMPASLSSSVKADIQDALKRRAILNTQGIMVSDAAGHVMLTGVVHSWSEREMIHETALKTVGVIDVVNNITVADQ